MFYFHFLILSFVRLIFFNRKNFINKISVPLKDELKYLLKINCSDLNVISRFFFLFLSTLLICVLTEMKSVSAQSATINFSGIVTSTPTEIDLNEELISQVDRFFSQEYTDHLDITPKNNISLIETPDFLASIDKATGTKSAIVYVYLQSIGSDILEEISKIAPLDTAKGGVLPPNKNPQATDELVLILATAKGIFTPIKVPSVNRRDLLFVQKQFQNNLVNLVSREVYLSQAIKLYEWLISPMKKKLKEDGTTHLSFIFDSGLRSLPIAALYDQIEGKYLVENYSLGLMPSLSLTNITRQNLSNAKVLAMGADTFPSQRPLPAVPVELNEIGKTIWNGKVYLNQDFTVENFRTALVSREYSIVHLATHGDFQAGDRNNSFVVFSDQNLTIDQFSSLRLDQPIDLLTLSACRTALGDPQAELGFAGLAVKTGVRTAIGSLWYVSDEGTFALMTSFYNQLKNAPTKAVALRQAQQSMIQGKIRVSNGQIIIDNLNIPLASLPTGIRESFINKDLSHPYYWSAFTLIGNPW